MNKEELMAKKEQLERELNEVKKVINNIDFEEKKELYGEKFGCKYCMYGAILEAYEYCGAGCVLGSYELGCKDYEPDNDITIFIKQANSFIGRSGRLIDGAIDEKTYFAIKKLIGDIFDAELSEKNKKKIIDILKILYEVKE